MRESSDVRGSGLGVKLANDKVLTRHSRKMRDEKDITKIGCLHGVHLWGEVGYILIG